jgi:superfamily II DNA or RNA helicase
MINLRDYQIETIAQLRQSFANGHKRIVLCLPTGAGKTIVFSEMVRLSHERNKSVLVLTDRKEIFKQTIRSLSRVGVGVHEIAPNARKEIPQQANIFLAMVETAKRRLPPINPDLIIIDECHKANFTKLIEYYHNAHVIGATATPVGKHFHLLYTDIVQHIDTPELVERGYLVPCRPYAMKDDFSDLETKMGEFSEASLDVHFNKTQLFDGVIENYQKYADNKKTIVFNVNIKHTINMTEHFRANGYSCEYVTSLTPAPERERILTAFTDGDFQVLLNCGILTTGYDEPSIECVIMNRATKSLPLWLQCCGRGSRTYPGKSEFVLLDFGGNHERHGLWNEPRTWNLKEKKKREGLAPVKTCPNCEAMLAAMARVCEFCGHEFPKPKQSELASGVMVEVLPSHLKGKRLSELSLQELKEAIDLKRIKATLAWRVVRSRDQVYEYAMLCNYKKGWVFEQSKKMNDTQFTDIRL